MTQSANPVHDDLAELALLIFGKPAKKHEREPKVKLAKKVPAKEVRVPAYLEVHQKTLTFRSGQPSITYIEREVIMFEFRAGHVVLRTEREQAEWNNTTRQIARDLKDSGNVKLITSTEVVESLT